MEDPKKAAPDRLGPKRQDTWASRLLGILAIPLIVIWEVLDFSYWWNSPYSGSSKQSGNGSNSVLDTLPLATTIMSAILGSILLFCGIPGIQLALQYPNPKTLSYATFARQMPQSGWYRIPDATVDLSAAVAQHISANDQGKNYGYYAPVYGPGGPAGGPCLLLLSVPSGTLPAQTMLSQKTVPQKTVTRPVEGVIETQGSEPDQFHADVTPLVATLAPSSLVINDGEHPKLGLSVVLALAGGLLLLLSAFLCRLFFFNKGKAAKHAKTREGSDPPRRREKVP